jgi:hypothetical protein
LKSKENWPLYVLLPAGAAFLASELAGHITGVSLLVDVSETKAI